MANFGEVNTSTTLIRQVSISLADIQKGGTAPTDATINTTPTIPALLFDATNELANIVSKVPKEGSDFTSNPELHLFFALVNSQTNGETLDMTMDYVTGKIGDNMASKTSTQVTAQTTVTTANGLAAGNFYEIQFTMTAGDANNPFDSDSDYFSGEFHLTNVTGVAAIHMLSGHLEYEGAY